MAALVTLLTGAALSFATPAYNPPGMNVGAPNPTPTKNGVQVPLTFSNTPNWNISPKLQKFVDTLAPLGCTTTNNLGQCIPVATPDIVTYPGSDYYEIEVVEYTEKMHSQLSPTTLRGYRQINNGTNTASCTDPSLGQSNPCTAAQNTVTPPTDAHYLGPMIIAQKDRPVRIKLVNNLPVGSLGDLFVPVDESLMGAGQGPLKADGTPCTMEPAAQAEPGSGYLEHAADCAKYPQNRAELHLHGGLNPWISDGTPHQWITPAGEITPYKRGVSAQNVPDMPDPGPGAVTYYYTNQQSARLMFYHDHAVGLTRLNVYVGMAAGYLIQDPVEKDLVDRGLIPSEQIPLIIQDKSFVDPATIGQKDPTWKWGTTNPVLPGTVANGDLWWPHVYMVAENPYLVDGINPMGRWVYGLWFWPPTTNIPYQLEDNPYYDPACDAGPTAPGCVTALAYEPPKVPKFPLPSWVAEAFLDTMMVNGTVYPTLTLNPKAYRFRILNAAHDRFLNLQLYEATTTIKECTITNPGANYEVGDILTFQGNHHAGKYPSDAEISVTAVDTTGAITAFRIDNYGSMYNAGPLTFSTASNGFVQDTLNPLADGFALSCTTQSDTEVAMVPAVNYREYKPLNKQYIPNDNRDGGVPNPTLAGPSWLQIGTESGFLAKPVLIPNYPVTFLTDPTMFNVGNVMDGTLRMGPAERADVIIDFCQYAGKTLILYNDAPAAYPAAVANNDYYTGAPDLSDAGGASEVIPGYGPNTRTIMQIKVNPGGCTPFNAAPLMAEFDKDTTTDTSGLTVFEKGQEPIIVGQNYYDRAYFTTASGVGFPWKKPNWGVSEIGDNYLNYFDPVFNPPTGTTPTTTYMQPKAIHDEMGGVYDEYGRMSARLGVEVPLTFALNQTFVMQSYVDPPTEIIGQDEVQIWKITHNGVDTHPMHFHLFDVQVINRVGWDGFKRLPDDNERGWKETVKISPLEDTIVALKPRAPKLPFGLPDSIRHLAPALPPNTTQYFTNLQTSGANVGQAKNPLDNNQIYNFGDEYVWHCHILSHEEQDMMRPIQFNSVKIAPDPFNQTTATTFSGRPVTVSWVDTTPANDPTTPGNPKNEIGFRIERCGTVNAGGCTSFEPIARALANQTTYTDATATNYPYYSYRVVAWNAAGETVATTDVTTAIADPISGVCGTSNGSVFTAAPTTNLCATGTPTAVTGTGPWNWSCTGFNGGSNATCTAQIQQYVVSFSANANGTLTGDVIQLVNHGGNSTPVIAVANPGYRFLTWKDGFNATVSTVPSFTATNVTTNQFYTAYFYVPKDFNSDGKVDLLWTDTATNTSVVWFMNNATKLAEANLPAPPPAVSPAKFVIQAAADFNHDGQTDLLYRNQSTGQTVLYLMSGVNKTSEIVLPSLNVNWEVAGVADFNGDGHNDILWRRHDRDTNNLFVWYMTESVPTAVPPYMANLARQWRVGGVADFNGDGKSDILWRRTDQDTNNSMIWTMNGVTQTGTINLPNLNRNWTVGAVGDFNADGNADIVWRRYDRDTNNTFYWYMNNAGAPTAVSSYLTNQARTWTMVGK